MPKFQALIFDMDDTLYPECDYVLSGFRAVALWGDKQLQIAYSNGYAKLCQLFKSGVRKNTFDLWLEHFSHDVDQWVMTCVEIYQNHQPKIRLFEGVSQALHEFQPHHRLGLLSDGYLHVQQAKFQALGIADMFEAVVFSDALGRDAWKPSTRPFLHILDILQIEAQNAVYIGDNPTKDFGGPREIGMKSIWLKQGQGEYKHLVPPNARFMPDYILDSWSALSNYLLTK